MFSILTEPREYLLPRIRNYFTPKPVSRYEQVASAFEALLNSMWTVETLPELVHLQDVQRAVRNYKTLVFDAGLRSGHSSLILKHAEKSDVVIVQAVMLASTEKSFAGSSVSVISDDNLDVLKPLLYSKPLATIWCDSVPALDIHQHVTSVNQRIVILGSQYATIDFALKEQADSARLQDQVNFLMCHLSFDLSQKFHEFLRENPRMAIADATRYFLAQAMT